MPLNLEEILALPDIGQKINYLKKGRKTELPDRCKLWDDWNPERHEIMVDEKKYPDRKVLEKEAEKHFDEKTGKTYEIEAKYKTEPVNRISIPLEQDIVNIQTAFTVGTEPSMDCTPTDDDEKKLLDAVKAVFKSNKIKYQNKKVVRAWLSEQEAAEYWYVTDDDSFWAKFWKKVKTTFGGKVKPTKKLKSVLWSPFRGDKLYPFFNDEGKMIAFSREYKKKLMDDSEITCFMTITDKMVYQWDLSKGYEERTPFTHGFPKLPVLYAYRPEPYCKKIKTFRVRLEKLLSNYADCIDYHFFPLLKLIGDVEGFMGKVKDRMVKLTGEGADAQYLTWNQVPDTVRFEAETLTNMAYDLYKRISCNEYTHRYSSAIFEITFDYYTNRTIDPLTFGWVIAYKNYENVRNCFLCKYYKTNYYTSERICCLYKKKGIERHCKSSEALRCNEFSIDKNIINENCDYLSYITYNIWKKGMGNEGIDYIKGKVAQ